MINGSLRDLGVFKSTYKVKLHIATNPIIRHRNNDISFKRWWFGRSL